MTRKAFSRLSGLGALLVFANLLLWFGGHWEISRLYFTGILLICLWPLVQLVAEPDHDLPCFPVILLIYGGYYGLMGMIPFEPYKDMALVSESALRQAGLYGLIGILALQVGYRITTTWHRKEYVYRSGGPAFDIRRIVILGVAGVLGWMGAYAGSVPIAVRTVAVLGSELLILAFVVLLDAQLRGGLARKWKVLNWCLFAPTILVTALGASKVFPLVRVALLVLIVYFFVKRRVPWGALAVAILFLVPVFFLKIGIRQFEVATNKVQNQTLSSTKDRLALYGAVLSQIKETANQDLLWIGLDTTANRFDLTHTFAYVIADTPEPVPYLKGRTYEALLWKLIPRAIYPEKSFENWGNEFGHRYGWLASDDDDTTVNLPQLIEWYINFGPVGILVGMFGIGLIYGGLRSVLYRDHTVVQGLFTIFVFSRFFNIESNFSLVFGSLPYALPVYALLGRWALDRHQAMDPSSVANAEASYPKQPTNA